ncbi:hypothetical protein J6590_070496 [Homalodisca vitripennis]|nr:hypothetical protein J6590_070496 [Homalodisca vitripennis]
MSSDEEDVLLLAAATCVLLFDRELRRFWVRPSLASRGVYCGSDLFKDLNPRELTCSKTSSVMLGTIGLAHLQQKIDVILCFADGHIPQIVQRGC